MTDQEIKELFDKMTGPIPNEDYYRAISLRSFKAAVQYIESKAHFHGLQEGMDKMIEAVQTGLKASAV